MATELQKLQGFLDTKEVEVKVEKDPKLRSLRRVEDVMKLITEGITKEEFLKSFKSVVNIVLKVEKDLIAKIQTTTAKSKDNLDQLREDSKKSIGVLEGKLSNSVDSALREQENGMNFIRDKVRRIKEGIDGKDGKRGEGGKDGKDGKDGRDGVSASTEKLEDKILELEKKIEELPTRRLGGTGGDGNVAYSLLRLIKKETPEGLVNGTNKVYTTKNAIKTIIHFAINGESIMDDEYTFSGSTITMTTAIPSGLSGKSFRIVYV